MGNINELKQQLKELVSIPSPSGFEGLMIKHINKKVNSFGLKTAVDPLGNVMVKVGKQTGKPKVMVFAHMDEVGFIVRKIEKNGFLRVEKIGGIPEKVLPGLKVMIKTSKDTFEEGVIGVKSHHFTPADEKKLIIPIEEIYIDTGYKSKEEILESGINVGSPITYSREYIEKDTIIFSPSIDNRAGCLILLSLLERIKNKSFNPEVFIVWSVQEEFNLRGILPAVRTINPDFAIALDCAIACDTPDLDKTDIGLGCGPVINAYSFHGRGTLGGVIPNDRLKDAIIISAKKSNIPFQLNVFYGGLTDASFLQLENKGIPSIEIGFPIRYSHSPLEACDLKDIELTIKLLEGFITSLKDKLNLNLI